MTMKDNILSYSHTDIQDNKSLVEFMPGSSSQYRIVFYTNELAKVYLENGKTFMVSRYCTHEGINFFGGYIRDGIIVCPKHNLPFSLEDNMSPCMYLDTINNSEPLGQ